MRVFIFHHAVTRLFSLFITYFKGTLEAKKLIKKKHSHLKNKMSDKNILNISSDHFCYIDAS